jgi:uncharacterized membrane protein
VQTVASEPTKPPSRIRPWLQTELDAWVKEGLVSQESARTLSARYALDSPRHGTSHLLAAVVLGIGGLLIGGGIMALVAANWEELPAMAKLSGMFVLLLARLSQLDLGFGFFRGFCGG